MLRAYFIALILSFAVARPATSAPFTIDAWDLTTGIIVPNDSDGRFFLTVQNPFEDAHSLTMPAWSSASAYCCGNSM